MNTNLVQARRANIGSEFDEERTAAEQRLARFQSSDDADHVRVEQEKLDAVVSSFQREQRACDQALRVLEQSEQTFRKHARDVERLSVELHTATQNEIAARLVFCRQKRDINTQLDALYGSVQSLGCIGGVVHTDSASAFGGVWSIVVHFASFSTMLALRRTCRAARTLTAGRNVFFPHVPGTHQMTNDTLKRFRSLVGVHDRAKSRHRLWLDIDEPGRLMSKRKAWRYFDMPWSAIVFVYNRTCDKRVKQVTFTQLRRVQAKRERNKLPHASRVFLFDRRSAMHLTSTASQDVLDLLPKNKPAELYYIHCEGDGRELRHRVPPFTVRYVLLQPSRAAQIDVVETLDGVELFAIICSPNHRLRRGVEERVKYRVIRTPLLADVDQTDLLASGDDDEEVDYNLHDDDWFLLF